MMVIISGRRHVVKTSTIIYNNTSHQLVFHCDPCPQPIFSAHAHIYQQDRLVLCGLLHGENEEGLVCCQLPHRNAHKLGFSLGWSQQPVETERNSPLFSPNDSMVLNWTKSYMHLVPWRNKILLMRLPKLNDNSFLKQKNECREVFIRQCNALYLGGGKCRCYSPKSRKFGNLSLEMFLTHPLLLESCTGKSIYSYHLFIQA